MEQIMQQLTPSQVYQMAKKNHHTYKLASQPQSINGRDFLHHHLSLKKQAQNQQERLNFRRGLTYIQQIVNFKEQQMQVERKGLRKFRSLLPQWLDIKKSFLSQSKFYEGEKERVMKSIRDFPCQHYKIYVTQKANGENAQISAHGEFWVIASKNKSLLMKNYEEDQKNIKFKHQYFLVLQIAKQWFSLLQKLPEQSVEQLKKELQDKTLIGEHCNSTKNPHLVDYGKQTQMFFYAIVDKNDKVKDCYPTSFVIDFAKRYQIIRTVKIQEKEVGNFELLLQQLKRILYDVSQASMKQQGQGKVVYITGLTLAKNQRQSSQNCLVILKVKTLDYMIFRKLREKLKVYFQKLTNKSYQRLYKNYCQEAEQLVRQFKPKRSLQEFLQIGKRAFEFCDGQSKEIARYVNTNFVNFLSILENKKINKQIFLGIVRNQKVEIDEQILDSSEEKKELQLQNNKQQSKNQGQFKKQLLVFIPVTIPSTGKSSLFAKIQQRNPNYDIKILSSDVIRQQVMNQMMKQKKNITKKQAFEKSRPKANDIFDKEIGNIVKGFGQSDKKHCIFLVDKNHPQNAIAKTVSTIKNKVPKNVQIRTIGLFTKSQEYIQKPGKYFFPFSFAYPLACMKRVIQRQNHETLEGTQQERVNIVLGFTNLLRNFSLSEYNIEKYFDQKACFMFHNDKEEWTPEIKQLMLKIVLGSKPGRFDMHDCTQDLVKLIKEYKNVEVSLQQSYQYAQNVIKGLFDSFEQLGGKKTTNQEQQVEKKQKKSKKKK